MQTCELILYLVKGIRFNVRIHVTENNTCMCVLVHVKNINDEKINNNKYNENNEYK